MGVVFFMERPTDPNAVAFGSRSAKRFMPLVGLGADIRPHTTHGIDADELKRRIKVARRRLGEHEVAKPGRAELSSRERQMLFGGAGLEEFMDWTRWLWALASDAAAARQPVWFTRCRVRREGRRGV